MLNSKENNSKVTPLLIETKMNAKSIDFFYDARVSHKLNNRSVDELRAHLILLNDTNDTSLVLSSLVDGNSISFLFDDSNKNKKNTVSNVKEFIRNLNEQQQSVICKYYFDLYTIIVNYHDELNALYFGFGRYCDCLCSSLQKNMIERITVAYEPVLASLER